MTVALRPRVVERLRQAAAYPITLMFAPAGSGKSVALEQFSATLERSRTVDAMSGLNARKFIEALDAAIGQSRNDAIIVDSLQSVQSDPAVIEALVARIAETISTRRWILASRSSFGLPVGTWLSYGNCGGIVGSDELAFTADEIRDAAVVGGCTIEREELQELVSLTHGWSAAVGVALRAIASGADRSQWRATVREAAYRLYEERTYPEINPPQRELLLVAAALPEIDVPLLELAGFRDARRLLDEIHQRTGLLTEEPEERYRMPQLFREFLRRRIDLGNADERSAVYVRAATALESAGRTAAALDAYGMARAGAHLLRLLQDGGFDLLERGQSAVIARAIDLLSDAHKRSNPRILALRGVLQSLAGNPVRAEALLRRSLSRAGNDRDLIASVSIKLSLVLTNRGQPNDALLLPLVNDGKQDDGNRGEAWSLLAASYGLAGQREESQKALDEVKRLLSRIDSEPVRARILQRAGVAAMYGGKLEEARDVLSEAAELSLELGLFSLASRAYANLSNLMLHRFDDVDWQLWYAEKGAASAIRAGSQFDIETALLQLLDAQLRLGRRAESCDIEDQIQSARSPDQSRAHYLAPGKALRSAWDGRFDDAHSVLVPSWAKLHHTFDRAVSGAQCSLYLAIDGRRDASISTAAKVIGMLSSIDSDGPFYARSIAIAQMCCATAEAVNGRQAHADRILSHMSTEPYDAVVSITRSIGDEIVASTRRRNRSDRQTYGRMNDLMERLSPLGYTHIARLFISANFVLESRKPEASGHALTTTEVNVLQSLADGFSPKEIALRRRSSVNTVRKHIARAITKLRCNGHTETIAVARRMGLLA